jgi:hypothetical protein
MYNTLHANKDVVMVVVVVVVVRPPSHQFPPFVPKEQKGFQRKKDYMPKVPPQNKHMVK